MPRLNIYSVYVFVFFRFKASVLSFFKESSDSSMFRHCLYPLVVTSYGKRVCEFLFELPKAVQRLRKSKTLVARLQCSRKKGRPK